MTRFWGESERVVKSSFILANQGRGLFYILTAMVLISMGDPSTTAAGNRIMAFAAGVVMFGVGALYILISVFSCCKCFPIPCCSRCKIDIVSFSPPLNLFCEGGRGTRASESDGDVYHEYTK